jgi:hypothetical protein
VHADDHEFSETPISDGGLQSSGEGDIYRNDFNLGNFHFSSFALENIFEPQSSQRIRNVVSARVSVGKKRERWIDPILGKASPPVIFAIVPSFLYSNFPF